MTIRTATDRDAASIAAAEWSTAATPGRLVQRPGEIPAAALYKRFGFAEEGRLRGRVSTSDGQFVDDIAMAWFSDSEIEANAADRWQQNR